MSLVISEEESIELLLGPLTEEQFEQQRGSLEHEMGLWLQITALLREFECERQSQILPSD